MFGCLGNVSRMNLHHRTNHYEVPIRTLPLPPHRAIQYRSAHQSHQKNRGAGAECLPDPAGSTVIALALPKCETINTAGKSMNRAMSIALRFIQALAASENKIHAFEKLLLKICQARVRSFESRKLIHAIVN